MKKRSSLALLLCSLLLSGCPATSTNSSSNAPDPPGEAGQPADGGQGDGSAAADIDVAIKSWDETQQLVDAHQGKVVVVDLWSTTCEPCVREFPGLVKLHNDFPEDVACISVSTDYYGDPVQTPESFREKVTKFLADKGASFDNVICSDPSDEVMAELGVAAVPVVLIYGRDGELEKRFDNDDFLYGDEGFTYEDHVRPLVESLVAEDAATADPAS